MRPAGLGLTPCELPRLALQGGGEVLGEPGVELPRVKQMQLFTGIGEGLNPRLNGLHDDLGHALVVAPLALRLGVR